MADFSLPDIPPSHWNTFHPGSLEFFPEIPWQQMTADATTTSMWDDFCPATTLSTTRQQIPTQFTPLPPYGPSPAYNQRVAPTAQMQHNIMNTFPSVDAQTMSSRGQVYHCGGQRPDRLTPVTNSSPNIRSPPVFDQELIPRQPSLWALQAQVNQLTDFVMSAKSSARLADVERRLARLSKFSSDCEAWNVEVSAKLGRIERRGTANAHSPADSQVQGPEDDEQGECRKEPMESGDCEKASM